MSQNRKSGMAVTNNIGNQDHIYPEDKRTVGERLAPVALKKDCKKDIPFSWPIFSSMISEGKRILLSCHDTEGLNADQETLKPFEIAGSDSRPRPVNVKISGKKIIVFPEKVKKPVTVCFTFPDTAQARLYNGTRLLAAAFRTDNSHFNI